MPISLPASRFLRLALIAGCFILTGLSTAPRVAAARVPVPAPANDIASSATISLQINNKMLTAEVADTEDLRAQGLMYRKTMSPDHGMIFAFRDDQSRCFWMKNTPIPLAIAFIDKNGTIVSMDEMQPLTEIPHCSGAAARYALEMNRNWFRSHGVRVGDNIKAVIPDTLPAARDGLREILQ